MAAFAIIRSHFLWQERPRYALPPRFFVIFEYGG